MFGLSHGKKCHFNQMFQSKVICVFYEYAYLYYAYLGRSIHECLNVHIASHTSCPDMQERHLLHESILLNMYKMDIFKIQIPNIWVLFWFISKKNSYFRETLVPTSLLQLPNTLMFILQESCYSNGMKFVIVVIII
jgi:hypothetical protein